jgi:putative heme-binding domain-containing protein
LTIAGARLEDDGRTLVLGTDPHPQEARYQLSLQSPGGSARTVTYDLSGLEANWAEGDEPLDGGTAWKGWWPEPSFDAVRRLAAISPRHQRLLNLVDKPGRLSLSAMLTLPTGVFRMRIEASGPISEATIGDEQPEASDEPARSGLYTVDVRVNSTKEPMFLSFTVRTGLGRGQGPLVNVRFAGEKGDDFMLLPRSSLRLPWSPQNASVGATAVSVPDLSGGDAARGEAIFFGEQARCSQCHAVGDRGGRFGPVLSDIGSKGKDSIYRSIAAPSEEIAPEFRPYTVATRDGRLHVGIVRAEGAERILVTDTEAKSTSIARTEIEDMRPSGTSIMPVGLTGTLGEEKLRDLMAYLLSLRPR